MSVQSEISRLQAAKTGLASVLAQAGTTVPASATLDEYPALFSAALQGGATYLYKAAFALDAWSGSPATQTVTLTPMYGAPAFDGEKFGMASGMCVEGGFPDDTQRQLKAAGGVIDRAIKKFSGASLTCTCRGGQRPDCDVEVYFLAKKEM